MKRFRAVKEVDLDVTDSAELGYVVDKAAGGNEKVDGGDTVNIAETKH